MEWNVGERVIWVALRNSPQHYMPGEKLAGKIICAFDNGGRPTYRIRLDTVWNEKAIGEPIGRPIVVGNVMSAQILPIVG